MMARADFTPSRCPAMRGKPRWVAQRPLPSMMTATWAGTPCADTSAMSSGSPSVPSVAGSGIARFSAMGCGPPWLEREDLLLLLLQGLVDPGDEAVGGLLDLVVAPALLVLGDFLVLGERLELVVGVAADVAHRHPRILRHLARGLHELLAALLGGRGHREPDDLAVVGGRDAEVGLRDGLLDLLELRDLPRLDDERARIGRGQRRHLADGRGGAIVVDAHGIEDGRGRAPRPHGGELAREGFEGGVHVGVEIFQHSLHASLLTPSPTRWIPPAR